MATLGVAYNISESALSAEQSSLVTIANNTANATTPGYTEESATWQQADPLVIGGTAYGDGVATSSAVSRRDLVLNRAIDLQDQQQSATQARLTALQYLQAGFSTATSIASSSSSSSTATGIGSTIGSFFGALEQLAASPADPSLRATVLSSASDLSGSFNAAAAGLRQQQVGLNGQVASVVTQANGLLQSLASLNAQIQSQDPASDAGTLEDQRQQEIAQLSQLIGVDQTTTEKNGLNLSTVDGTPLLLGNRAVVLSAGSVDGAAHIYAGPADAVGTADITAGIVAGGGQAAGLLQVAEQDIPAALASLDTLAYQLGTQVNSLNEGGTDLNGNSGGVFFNLPPASTGSAGAISVAIADPSRIAAAASGEGPSDGENAAAMVALESSATIDGSTPSNYFAGFISSLGATVAQVDATNSAQQGSIEQLTNQQTALSGVSLDTEATALQNMEQAYQAASKVFTVIDSLVAASINLGTATTV